MTSIINVTKNCMLCGWEGGRNAWVKRIRYFLFFLFWGILGDEIFICVCSSFRRAETDNEFFYKILLCCLLHT
jgi:hypothetical protein